MSRYKYIIFFISVFSSSAFAYLHTQTISGINIHWPISINIVDIYVNSQNRFGLVEADIQNIAQNSVGQWNGLSRLNLRKNTTTGKNQPNLNEIYFSSDPAFFGGTAVKGVTQVSYKQDTGEILEADILIDDTLSLFTTTVTDINFIGNVFTHELGHLLGLAHGQVLGSTMFYELSYGQSQLADDDKSGIFSTYPIPTAVKKAISGQVIGGKNLIPVFGAHIQAISNKTGHVAASGVSDKTGRFTIEGLATTDQYFLYTSPLLQIGLPANYANIKTDFCESYKNYRGSFFQSCGANGEGYPQAVNLVNSNVDVGQMTIRCGLDVPPEYIQLKGQSTSLYNLPVVENGKLGNTFIGYFSAQEMLRVPVIPDQVKINLSALTSANLAAYSAGPLYLEVKILNQLFFSPFKAAVVVSGPATSINVPLFTTESDGFMSLDTIVRIPINQVNLSDNNFTFQISPQKNVVNISNYFPSLSIFQDPMYLYFMNVGLVTSNDGGLTFSQVSSRNYQVTDNVRCPDALNTYALTNFNTGGSASTASGNQKKTVMCGSVDMENSGGNGPRGFFIGIALCCIFALIRSRFRQRLL
jgi:hypothetical protein